MRTVLTRFTCDNPDCEDTAEVEGPPAAAGVAQVPAVDLPEGWIEFAVRGVVVGDNAQMPLVHASSPKCAAKLAEAQVGFAEQAAKENAVAAEEQRQRSEEMAAEASKEVEKAEKEEAKRRAEAERAVEKAQDEAEKAEKDAAGEKGTSKK